MTASGCVLHSEPTAPKVGFRIWKRAVLMVRRSMVEWVTTVGFVGKSDLPAYPQVADGTIAAARNSNRGQPEPLNVTEHQ